MITEHLFPTLLYVKDLPNANELNNYLEQKIMQWSQQDKGLSKTNAGGWHSGTDMNKKEEYNVLTRELFKMQEEIFTKERLSDKSVLGNMWANINYPGNFNRPHIHPNALFSGVYYIKAPKGSGNLMVYDPRPGIHMIMPNRKGDKRTKNMILDHGPLPSELWREVHYEPVAGRIIMFPAWLWHEVKPNESNDTRISVSFNFLQR